MPSAPTELRRELPSKLEMALPSLVGPAYVGWARAAFFHGFIGKSPSRVIVACNRHRKPSTSNHLAFRFVKQTEAQFFGYRRYEINGTFVLLSDPAKTIADCLARPDLLDGQEQLIEMMCNARNKVDADEVIGAALRMGSVAALQRFGFLADVCDWTWQGDQRDQLAAAIPASSRLIFGRNCRRQQDVGYVKTWRLFAHIDAHSLRLEPSLFLVRLEELPKVRKGTQRKLQLVPGERMKPGSASSAVPLEQPR